MNNDQIVKSVLKEGLNKELLTEKTLYEISPKKFNQKLNNAGMSVDEIASQGKKVLDSVRSELKSQGVDVSAIESESEKMGGGKNLSKIVSKKPQETAIKIMKRVLTKDKLKETKNPTSILLVQILTMNAINKGLVERFDSVVEPEVITAMSLLSLPKGLQNSENIKPTKAISEATSWIMPISRILQKYKSKKIQKLMISYILTNSNISSVKKLWNTGKIQTLSKFGIGIGGALALGTATTAYSLSIASMIGNANDNWDGTLGGISQATESGSIEYELLTQLTKTVEPDDAAQLSTGEVVFDPDVIDYLQTDAVQNNSLVLLKEGLDSLETVIFDDFPDFVSDFVDTISDQMSQVGEKIGSVLRTLEDELGELFS